MYYWEIKTNFMRKLLLIAFALFLIIGCKKKTVDPVVIKPADTTKAPTKKITYWLSNSDSNLYYTVWEWADSNTFKTEPAKFNSLYGKRRPNGTKVEQITVLLPIGAKAAVWYGYAFYDEQGQLNPPKPDNFMLYTRIYQNDTLVVSKDVSKGEEIQWIVK